MYGTSISTAVSSGKMLSRLSCQTFHNLGIIVVIVVSVLIGRRGVENTGVDCGLKLLILGYKMNSDGCSKGNLGPNGGGTAFKGLGG